MLGTDFDTSFTLQFYQVFRDFIVWYPSCAWAVFSSSAATKIVNFCSQYRENFSNTVILLVSLNIILWHQNNKQKSNIQLITLQKNINKISLSIIVTVLKTQYTMQQQKS